MKYKLLIGKHTEPDNKDYWAEGARGGRAVNDVVESDVDLCEKWNRGGEVRFAAIASDGTLSDGKGNPVTV